MASKIKAELLAIQKASKDRMLHASAIVTWARKNRRSALHRQFEWNNSKAAAEYRLWQARRLVQIHIITAEGGPQVVSLSFDRTKGGGYRSVSDVLSSRDLSEIMFNDAMSELQRVQARFHRVRELTSVWSAVKRVKQRKAAKALRFKKAA